MPISSKVGDELLAELGNAERRVGGQLRELAECGRRLTSLEEELAAVRTELRSPPPRGDAALGAHEPERGKSQELAELAATVKRSTRDLAVLTDEGDKLRIRIQELSATAEADRQAWSETERHEQSERERLEADLEATRAERMEALERLSTAQVASQTHRKRLEGELQMALTSRAQEIEELHGKVEELSAATADRQRLTSELKAARTDGEERLARMRTESQAAVAEAAAERERIVAEAAAERERIVAEAAAERERMVAEAAAETQRMVAELASLRVEHVEVTRRLALRGEELETAVRGLTAIERTTASLEQALAELREETRALRADKAALTDGVEILTQHAEGLQLAVAGHERLEGELRSKISAAEADIGRRRARVRVLQTELQGRDSGYAELEGKLRGRETELAAVERHVETLELEQERTVHELRRVASSRAWRWGHWTTRALRRMAFRRTQRMGAVEKLLERLDRPPTLPASEPRPPQDEAAAELPR